MSTSGAGDSVARAAITDAARRLGHDDPFAVVDDLVGVDVGGLRAWSGLTSNARQSLSDGTGRLTDALGPMAAGWSNPAPQRVIHRQREAGLAARDVLGRQVDAAQDVIGTLESTRLSAQAEVTGAEARILATGWPPGADLLGWAAGNGALPVVSATIGGLADAVIRLRSRNDAALESLTTTLRTDPAEAVDTLLADMHATNLEVALPAGPGLDPPAEIDRANLDHLAADLQSSDLSVQFAALGVQAALDKARAEGGQAQLLVYESASSTSQGRAAISIGDITWADNVVTKAPGVSSAPATMSDGIGTAVGLRDRAEELDPSARTAVVAWYGYNTPLGAVGGSPMTPLADVANVAAATSDVNARVGGVQLVEDLKNFRALAPQDARFVGIGFSMGSTVVSAAGAHGADFDDLVMLGSPGASIDVGSAADYPGTVPEHVWVGSYDQDPITTGVTDNLAGALNGLRLNRYQPTAFGPDPADADFGARVLDVQSNVPDPSVDVGGLLGWVVNPLANKVVDLSAHHSEDNYLSGASLDAVASIVVGHYDDVPVRPGR